jgi:hypothetical protein
MVLTDHANLNHWKTPKKVNRRVARWFGELQEYNIVIQHIPGKLHTAADMLFRPPVNNKGEQDNNDLTLLPEEMFIRCQTDEDLESENIKVMMSLAQECRNQEMKEWERTYKTINILHLPHQTQDPQWFKDCCIVIPTNLELRRKITQWYHDTPTAGHPGRDETIQAVK